MKIRLLESWVGTISRPRNIRDYLFWWLAFPLAGLVDSLTQLVSYPLGFFGTRLQLELMFWRVSDEGRRAAKKNAQSST